MAMRIPRGYDVARPYYNELCEGVRPVAGAIAQEAWTGLAYTRIDEYNHDPIVIEPGTLIGMVTGGNGIAAGKIVPATLGTGAIFATTGGGQGGGHVVISFPLDAPGLIQVGESNVWGLPSTSGNHAVGRVKPMGVCYQPIYSFMLQNLYTNYTRNTAVGAVTDYVIQVPAINSDEWAIEAGDTIILGTGRYHGSGAANTHLTAFHLAGRYARMQSYFNLSDVNDRVVGRCLRKIKLGSGGSSTSQGDQLASKLSDFTLNSSMTREFANLARVQTVPGMNLTGSGTKGIPAYYLGARADANKDYWGLTLLIRL